MKLLTCVCMSGLLVAISVIAEEDAKVNFTGSVSMGYSHVDSPKISASSISPSYLVQGSTAYGDAYISVGYATPLNKHVIADESAPSYADIDLSLGYRIAKHWKVFAGYSDTEKDGDSSSRAEAQAQKIEYLGQDGFYLGSSYSFDLGRPGTILLNMGYTSLDTSRLFRTNKACDLEAGDCGSAEESAYRGYDANLPKGNTDSWSYGVMWLMPLTENMAFNTSLKLNEYKDTLDVEGESVSADQKSTFFNLGVYYSF